MKNFIFLVVLSFTQIGFANILDSTNESRHDNKIVQAIAERCGLMAGLTQVSQTEEKIHVDNGIMDVNYKTVLTGKKRFEQNIFDVYVIEISSSYSDAYDHDSKNWGFYWVESVECTLAN